MQVLSRIAVTIFVICTTNSSAFGHSGPVSKESSSKNIINENITPEITAEERAWMQDLPKVFEGIRPEIALDAVRAIKFGMHSRQQVQTLSFQPDELSDQVILWGADMKEGDNIEGKPYTVISGSKLARSKSPESVLNSFDGLPYASGTKMKTCDIHEVENSGLRTRLNSQSTFSFSTNSKYEFICSHISLTYPTRARTDILANLDSFMVHLYNRMLGDDETFGVDEMYSNLYIFEYFLYEGKKVNTFANLVNQIKDKQTRDEYIKASKIAIDFIFKNGLLQEVLQARINERRRHGWPIPPKEEWGSPFNEL